MATDAAVCRLQAQKMAPSRFEAGDDGGVVVRESGAEDLRAIGHRAASQRENILQRQRLSV